MATRDARLQVAESIGNAMGELSEALAELERMPDDESLVGFVAHAMDNYLSVTKATLGFVECAIGDHPNREIRVWLEGLQHLGVLMQHTVERLLRTPTATEVPLRVDYVNLPVLLQRACDYHRPSAARKQLDITCRSIGDVPPAWADRVGVAVTANNLLSNAIQLSEPGGQIVVQIMAGPGGVVVSICNHGRGLTFLEHARLFEHAESPAALPAEGDPALGHGLAIAKELVDGMGGRLWAENQAGGGTSFFFRLPYQPYGPRAVG